MTFTKNFDKEHYAKEQQDRMKEIQERIKILEKILKLIPISFLNIMNLHLNFIITVPIISN